MARSVKKAGKKERPSRRDGDGGREDPPSELRLWLNCECIFSVFLVALLAALPFNMDAGYFGQSRESFVLRAEELFSDGAFEKAAALYQHAVDAEETPDGHVFLAETLVRVSRVSEAIAHYERAADLYEDSRERVAALASVGRLHVESGAADLAVRSYAEVAGAGLASPEVADAHVQLAAHLLGAGTRAPLAAAVAHLQRAVSVAPTLSAAHLLLADAYRDLGLSEHAVAAFSKLLKYRPRDAPALAALAAAHHELGHFKQSLNAYRKASALAPASTDVKYALAALQGEPAVPPRAPPAYVESLFDLRSRRAFLRGDAAAPVPPELFLASEPLLDAHENATLDAYDGSATPEPPLFAHVHGLVHGAKLVDAALKAVTKTLGLSRDAPGGRWLDVLELGCGDGAAGPRLRAYANRLHGVDLSAASLAAARRTGAYDALERGELVATCRALLPDSVDLVVLVDAVPYLGDLADLLGAIAGVLRPGGVAIFNADVLDAATASKRGAPSSDDDAFRLSFTGRWHHARAYVKRTAKAVGLDVTTGEVLSAPTPLAWTPATKRVTLLEAPQSSTAKTALYALRKPETAA